MFESVKKFFVDYQLYLYLALGALVVGLLLAY